jgi:protein O-mannosyl-transferase
MKQTATDKRPQRPPQSKAAAPKRRIVWWPYAAALLAFVLIFQVYSPALQGGFVLDDRALPFFTPDITPDIGRFVGWLRPILMFSYWADFRVAGGDIYAPRFAEQFHSTNLILHTLVSIIVALIFLRLLEFAAVPAKLRAALAVITGAVFLLHPLQTESVAYVASRSEILSVGFYYAAFAVYLYQRTESITLWRSIAVLVLFGAALGTKEHTLTLPILILLTDYFWSRGGVRRNKILYGLIAILGAAGASYVGFILLHANTAGFSVAGMTPVDFFFTECRVLWTYFRLFFIPVGQNLDPDVPVSHSLLDHGAIFGLIALIALVAAAWIYRKKFPLACYGVFVFLLLIAPTSSVVPILDPQAERRLYLPFIGLLLILAEILRRLDLRQLIAAGAAIVIACSALTYQRAKVWSSPMALFQDNVDKSPNKFRPRFQLAFVQFEARQCASAVKNFETAARIGPLRDDLLIDWGLALGCAGNWTEAIEKFREALPIAYPTSRPHIHCQIAVAYANIQQFEAALAELSTAQQLDSSFAETYALRGQVYENDAKFQDAYREYKHACDLQPTYKEACAGAIRMSQRLTPR